MAEEGKLLIIDDEEIVLDSCTHILAGTDYQVLTARNGELGLQKLREYHPDLVFVDLKMPGISGFEVLDKIKELDPTIVCIVITGFSTVSSAVEAMQKGAYDFLSKPFTPDEFRMITRRGIEKRRLVLDTIALRKEKDMLRDQFAAIVSHELKSPLGAIQQNVFVLESQLSKTANEDQLHRLDRIKSRISDLLSLINTWLRVVSADIENLQDDFKPISIEDIILKAIEIIEPHAIRKNIQIITDFNNSTSQISGDRGTLIEVFVNLIGNAIKFSRMGSNVQINISELEDEFIEISVSDSGIGIAEDDLPFIFDAFYRGKPKSDSKAGSGLGLAISQRIIEVHKGYIVVESEFGKGSIFTVKLPSIQKKGKAKTKTDY